MCASPAQESSPLAIRTEDPVPLPPSAEESEVEAECSEDVAAAPAAGTGDWPLFFLSFFFFPFFYT